MTLLKTRLVKYVLVCSLLVLIVSSTSFHEAFARQLDRWRVLPQPERFTELYFSEPTKLSHLSKGQQQKFSFTVHNLEHMATVYMYRAFVQAPSLDKPQPQTGKLRLEHNQLGQVPVPITIPATSAGVIVGVQLEYQGIPFGRDGPEQQTQVISYLVK